MNRPINAPGLKDVLRVFLVPNGEKKENAYILFDSETCDGIFPIVKFTHINCQNSRVGSIVDPGVNGYKLLRAIETCQTNISKVFLTHAHESHIKCIGDIIESFGDIPIYLHEKDKALFEENIPKELRNSADVSLPYLL